MRKLDATRGTLLEGKVIRDNAPYLRPHIPAQMLHFFDKLVETALTLELAPSESGTPSSAAETIARLERELAIERSCYRGACMKIKELTSAQSASEANSRRYQWLKDNAYLDDEPDCGRIHWNFDRVAISEQAQNIDDAVDAAMKNLTDR